MLMRRIPAAAVMASAVGARFASGSSMDFLLNPTPEHAMLRETISKFAKERVGPQARDADVNQTFNTELFRELGALGAMGITVPEKFGGAGMDATASVIVHHELCKYDAGFTLAYLAHAVLFVNNFVNSANEAQIAKYLPGVLSGDVIGSMCMSEPGAGTDVLGMTTTATRNANGNYVIKGSKIWITNATKADVFIVYAKLDGKITSFIVERGMKGFSTGPKIDKCGMRASHMCQVFFDDVEVPKENLLGEECKGVKSMMRNLEIERITLAAMSVGIADRCCDEMQKYAKERKAFGQSIAGFGQIQRYIAESYAETEAAKAYTYAVSRSISATTQNRIGSDAAKLFATPVAKRVADNAIQVMGGMGYSRDMPVERLWRDAKLLEIGGGTLEAHHKNMTKDLLAQL